MGENPVRRNPARAKNKLAMRRALAHKDSQFQMPTYDYVCPKCRHAFEVFQSMNDAPLTQCPECKKRGLKRLIGGGSGLIFKGSGFYITDYKNKKPASAEPAAGKPAEKPTPAKPAAKPASAAA